MRINMDLQVLMNLYIIIMGVWHPSVHVVAILGSGFYWICSEGFFSDNHSDCSHILAQSQNIIHFRNSRINWQEDKMIIFATIWSLLRAAGWPPAVGAGLLKTEILEGVARLRISNDIEFEETFIDMIRAAKEVNTFLLL